MPDGAPVRFKIEDRVRVRVGSPPGHFRTPSYIQNQVGRVVAHCGTFPNPESLAHGGDGLPKQPLYRVEFHQSQVWASYSGQPADKIVVDIYQHWLEPA